MSSLLEKVRSQINWHLAEVRRLRIIEAFLQGDRRLRPKERKNIQANDPPLIGPTNQTTSELAIIAQKSLSAFGKPATTDAILDAAIAMTLFGTPTSPEERKLLKKSLYQAMYRNMELFILGKDSNWSLKCGGIVEDAHDSSQKNGHAPTP